MLVDTSDMKALIRYHQALLDALGAITEQLSPGKLTDEGIEEALVRLGQAMSVDRAYVLRNNRPFGDTVRCDRTYGWQASEATHDAAFESLSLTVDGPARWQTLFEQGELLAVKADDAPDAEQAFLAASGIESIVLVPIYVHDEWWGLLGVDVFTGPRAWSSIELSVLRTAAHLLSTILALQREDHWRQLVDNHPNPIVISVQSRIAYLNRAAMAVYGASTREDILGRSIFDFIPEDLISVFEARASMIYEHEEATTPLAHWLIGLDGTRRFVEAFSVPIMHEGYRAAQTVLRDITERQRYEAHLIQAKEQAEELNQLKTSFLASMSHEIRTPLTAILGFADLLMEEVGGESLEFAQLIRTSGQRLMDTLNSVLDLAQLEGRARTLQPRSLDLTEQARQIMHLFRPKIELSTLSFRLEPPEDGPVYASLDQGALGRTLINLIENALKFTDEGAITVSVRGDKTSAYLSVHDTGIGISEAFMPYLFDEFKQESEGLDRRYEGSGLGLTITKRLVNLMGGDISVTSKKGQGSTFTLCFPRLPDHLTPVPEPAAVPIDTFLNLAEPHLLLIEDNPDTARLLQQLLPPAYQLDTAGNVEDALVMARTTTYHAVLVDINLGNGYTGLDALHLFRSLPGYAQTPLLACTAYALPGDKERLLEAGFDGYISKPFERPHLHQTIKMALADRLSD